MTWRELLAVKFVSELTVLPFLVGVIAAGIVMIFLPDIRLKILGGFFLGFGTAGIVEYLRRNAYTTFHKVLGEAKKIQVDDGAFFRAAVDHVFGTRTKVQLKEGELIVDGLIFRCVETRKDSPFRTIAGPLCPNCDKPLTCDGLSFWHPVFTKKYRYVCPCGFKKLINKDPKSLYLEVRTYYNLPV